MTIPFFAYTACFLLAPTVIVIVGAFQNVDGGFTLNNFSKLFEANTIAAFRRLHSRFRDLRTHWARSWVRLPRMRW